MTPVQKIPNTFYAKYNKQPELTVYAPGRKHYRRTYRTTMMAFGGCLCAINYGTLKQDQNEPSHLECFAPQILILRIPFLSWWRFQSGKMGELCAWCREIHSRALSQFQTRHWFGHFGSVPHSSGLSSSAALEVATGKFCQQPSDLPYTYRNCFNWSKSWKTICGGANSRKHGSITFRFRAKDHLLMIDCRSLKRNQHQCRKMSLLLLWTQMYRMIWWRANTIHAVGNVKRQQSSLVKALRDESGRRIPKREAELTALNAFGG